MFQPLLKSALHQHYPIFQLIRDQLSSKKSALVLSQIFKLFINTLTHNEEYSCRNILIFLQQIQTPLSQKEKSFLDFLLHFENMRKI